jgi:hypothetical protein
MGTELDQLIQTGSRRGLERLRELHQNYGAEITFRANYGGRRQISSRVQEFFHEDISTDWIGKGCRNLPGRFCS